MIVGGGEQGFSVLLKRETAIEQSESHRRAVSQGDLGWIDAKIVRRCPEHGRLLFLFVSHPIPDRIGIQSAAMALDGLTYRCGM